MSNCQAATVSMSRWHLEAGVACEHAVGVIESPDRWSRFDEESTELAMSELDKYDAFVMGRETYERFRALWGSGSGEPYADRVNAMPKYVASRSLTEVTWNATLLGPDIVGAIEQLKAQPGKDLIKYGTSRLDATLLQAQLVDELRLWIQPVVVGSGQRLFEGIDPSTLDLELADVRKLANNSAILTYIPRSGATSGSIGTRRQLTQPDQVTHTTVAEPDGCCSRTHGRG